MEDVINMKSDVQRNATTTGWKAQMLSFYQSLVIFLGFILRILKEFFKKTGDVAAKTNEQTKSKATNGTNRLRSAGEIQVEDSQEEVSEISQHTVVDLPPHSEQISTETNPSVISIPTEPSKPDIGAFPLPVLAKSILQNILEPSNEQSKNTLVIKNLPFKFKVSDLEKLLNEHQGKLKNVRLLRDDSGKFTGMAFIRCASKEDAQRIILNMHGMEVGGRNIQVEFKSKKQKKKNGKLNMSSDSMSSSSDELPNNRIRINTDNNDPRISNILTPVNSVHVQPPRIAPQSAGNKLSVSAEHLFDEKQLKKAPQHRRKSASNFESMSNSYTHSAVTRIHFPILEKGPSIRPIRQPFGPDNISNGFSNEYKKSRTANQ